eukprot:m.306816 g.306816  ORF g.306816 m.306816 type:complete len:119 (+) comp41605_c0_seq1:188-544(+)
MADILVWAVKNAEMDQVKELAPKVDLNKPLLNGRMAIHFAADYGHPEVIKYLADCGADLNVKDSYGITPLLSAVYEGHVECIKLLIKMGAKKDGKGPDGRSYAESAESSDVRKALTDS